MSKTSNFITGAILGAAVGSIMVLLFTPKSGKDFREDLEQKTNQIIVEVKKAAEQRHQEMEEEINAAKAAD